MIYKLGSSQPTTLSTLSLSFLMFLCLVSCTHAFGSAIAWNAPPHVSSLDGYDSISDLLIAPIRPEGASLSRAKQIIHALSGSSTCAHAATARLLRQCKLIKPQHENQQAEFQKQNAQAFYAISMALCEARQARVSIPPACSSFEPMLDEPASDASIEIVSTQDIEKCSNELYQNNPSWTSYTAFKAQSGDLCDTSRIDYRREELLEHFRQATNIIPDIIDALREQQFETHLVMSSVRDSAAGVVASHREVSTLLQEQARESKQQLQNMSNYMQKHLNQMDESGQSFKAAVAEGIEHATQDLNVMQQQAGSVKVNLAEIYAAAAEAVSSMSIDIHATYDTMLQRTNAVAEQMVELATSGHLQAIQQSVVLGREAADEYATVQASQVEKSREQLSVSEQVLQTIAHSHGRLEEIQKAVDMIPTSWFDTLCEMQSHVLHIRNEIKYAMAFVVPSMLLMLFGRPRASVAAFLSYLLARSLWSIYRNTELPPMSMPLAMEELQMVGCTFLIAGCGIAALVWAVALAKSLLSADTECTCDLEAQPKAGRHVHPASARPRSHHKMTETLPRSPSKHHHRSFSISSRPTQHHNRTSYAVSRLDRAQSVP